jgi:hypothetical protein
MRESDKVKLLAGPYRPPALRVGQRATCLYRDCDVVVTGWTDALIPWPLCKRPGRGGPGLLVEEELARAIRTESATALMHWWGVGVPLVTMWRRAFGIGRMDAPGSARLVLHACQQGAEAVKAKEWTAEELEEKRQLSKELNLGQHLSHGYNLRPWWTVEELMLLGTMPDEDVAKRVGRTVGAVRRQRTNRGIANARNRRRKNG